MLGCCLLLWICGCAMPSSMLFSRVNRQNSPHARTEKNSLPREERANICLQTGLNLAANQKDDHAIAQMAKARELNPQLKGVAHPLAVLYDRQGRFGLAEKAYQSALQEEESNADLLNDFGYFRYSQGRFAEARTLLSEARKLNPEHSQATTNLAMVLAAEGDFETAYDLFSQAVGPAAAHQNIGLLMLRSGREDEAIAHLETACHEDPSLETAQTVLVGYSGNENAARAIRTVGYRRPE
ncbi:MAG: tetratricopeptide repeat protein [Planctomycetaceae bacterium]